MLGNSAKCRFNDQNDTRIENHMNYKFENTYTNLPANNQTEKLYYIKICKAMPNFDKSWAEHWEWCFNFIQQNRIDLCWRIQHQRKLRKLRYEATIFSDIIVDLTFDFMNRGSPKLTHPQGFPQVFFKLFPSLKAKNTKMGDSRITQQYISSLYAQGF